MRRLHIVGGLGLVLATAAGCSTAKPARRSAIEVRPATVREVVTVFERREMDGLLPIRVGAGTAFLSAALSRCSDARPVAALTGFAAGALWGHAWQSLRPDSGYSRVTLRLGDGTLFVLFSPPECRFRPSQEVWIALDSRGVPHHIIDTPADPALAALAPSRP